MTSEEQYCSSVEEQLVVDSEVLVHGGDLIQLLSADTVNNPLNPVISVIPSAACSGNAIQAGHQQQSVAVVEAGAGQAAAKALVWAYGRPAFYLSPAAAVLSGVPTAVVAPIKREIQNNGTTSSSSSDFHHQAVPDSAFQPNAVLSNDSPQTVPPSSAAAPSSKAHLPPFETFIAPAMSGGSTPITPSSSVSATGSLTTGAGASSAVDLCLATRPTESDRDDAAELIHVTSFYRHPLTSASGTFPFPVWSLPVAAEAATQSRSVATGTRLTSTDLLQVASMPALRAEAGHVTGQSLPVQQVPAAAVAEVVPSTSASVGVNECAS